MIKGDKVLDKLTPSSKGALQRLFIGGLGGLACCLSGYLQLKHT